MRKNPTEPERRVWRILCGSQMAGFKFRRQAVIPPFIADFLCPRASLIIEIDGDTHDIGQDAGRDRHLASRGYRTLRLSNHDVMGNIEGVASAIASALLETPALVDSPHPNPSPEGEGLVEVRHHIPSTSFESV